MDPAWSNDFHIYIYITSSKIAVFIFDFPHHYITNTFSRKSSHCVNIYCETFSGH